MKASRASIRYGWMRRAAQGITLAAGGVALLGSLCAGQASAATQSTRSHVTSAAAIPAAPPPPGSCYKARDGWLWVDLDQGYYWRCVQNVLGEWVWVPVGRTNTCNVSKAAIKPELPELRRLRVDNVICVR